MGKEISGDEPLKGRLLWKYRINAIREIVEDVFKSSRCSETRTRTGTLPSNIKTLPSGLPSPFRLYTDYFCITQIPKYCKKNDLAVLDVGCGSGGNIHQFYANGIKGTYTGIDLKPHPSWAEKEKLYNQSDLKCQFKAIDVGLIEGIGWFDCIFSTSALEHFPDIKVAIDQIARVTKPGGISFHVVPAPWSFPLYGPHGYRRFSRSKLCALFQNAGFEVMLLSKLGGLPSFMVHLVFITLPLRLLRRDPRKRLRFIYTLLLGTSVKIDRWLSWPYYGYAIVARKT